MKNEDNLLDSAARVFRDRLSSGPRFQALFDPASSGMAAVPFHGDQSPIFHLPHTVRLSRSVESTVTQVGDMPPAPPTMRGRMGALLIQAIRRALFWYTGQIRAFQALVAESAREQTDTLQELGGRQERQQQMLADLNRRLSESERVQTESVRLQEERSNSLAEQLAEQSRRMQELDEVQQTGRIELQQKFTALEQARTSLDEEERQRRAELDARLGQMEEALAEIRKAMESEGREVRQKIQHERASLLKLEVRLRMLLREIRKSGSTEQERSAGPAIAQELQHTNDALFVDHAAAFRGSREEIKSRLAVYAPYVRDAFASAGAPALDLGCGRGEWLELLREMEIPASGFDWNRELVASCRGMGLDAREGEVPGVLGAIPEESLSVITAFHVLEHVSLPDLLEVIDQALRILKPGGIAIFETPNPKNIFVSTNGFYLDPTHRHPIPSDLLAFVVEARGFCDPKVIPLSVPPEDQRLAGSDCPAVQFINAHFYSALDYGIVAFKV